jgi:hypothetical protein
MRKNESKERILSMVANLETLWRNSSTAVSVVAGQVWGTGNIFAPKAYAVTDRASQSTVTDTF